MIQELYSEQRLSPFFIPNCPVTTASSSALIPPDLLVQFLLHPFPRPHSKISLSTPKISKSPGNADRVFILTCRVLFELQSTSWRHPKLFRRKHQRGSYRRSPIPDHRPPWPQSPNLFPQVADRAGNGGCLLCRRTLRLSPFSSSSL